MLFAVFDGHGGKNVSQFCELNFKKIFMGQPDFKKGNFKEALRKTFFDLDEIVGEKTYGDQEGCTSVVTFFNDSHIWTANAGDSRAVLARSDGVQALSEDHKPDNEIEVKRITKAGHSVEISRVDGSLALSRAIGDFQFKDQKQLPAEEQAVTCDPDITEFKRSKTDQFIIIACDGIWDCLTNQEAVTKM